MDWTKHARTAVLSHTLMKCVKGNDGQDYDLDSPDDMYLLAFTTAQALVANPEYNGLVGHAGDYPFQSNRFDAEIRKMWDMGFADGIGTEVEPPRRGIPMKRGWA